MRGDNTLIRLVCNLDISSIQIDTILKFKITPVLLQEVKKQKVRQKNIPKGKISPNLRKKLKFLGLCYQKPKTKVMQRKIPLNISV